MGKFDNLHYALGCNGSGVAMMTYLGHETARKIAGKVNRANAFDTAGIPRPPALFAAIPGSCPGSGAISAPVTGSTAASDRAPVI